MTWSFAAKYAPCPPPGRRRCWCCPWRSTAARNGWFSTPTQLEIEPVKSVDPLRPVADVRANAVEVGDDRVLSNLSRGHARALISTLLSAECVGVARWATDTATAYAKIREQFGRPIGQFQAIKHKCAEMIADTERATAAVWDAARAIDEHSQNPSDETAFEFAAAVAATLAPAAVLHSTQDCIQVHGGIGFTWEHDTNVYYRRALLLAACFGRSSDYPQQVVDIATTTGMRRVDIDLDPETEKLRDEIRAEVEALKAIPSEERTTAIAEGGWVVPHLPKPWGRAASPVEQIIIAQEFSTGRVRRPTMGIATWLIPSVVAFGTEEQKQRFLPPTLRGEMIWCQLFSEPGAGSDLAGLTDQGHQGRRRLADHRPEDLDHRRAVLAVGHAAGADRPERSQARRHHVLPARYEQ